MAWPLSTPALPSWQVNMADTWWMNFLPIWKKDIWKDGEYFKWLLSSMDRKSFQELVSKAVKNRKRSGYVDCQRVRSIDRNLFFSKLKLLILRQWWQLWMNSAAIKQRYRLNLFFVVFCLIVLLPNSMSNWFTIDVSLHVSFLLTLHRCVRVCKRTIGSLFLWFSPLFSVVQLWNYTKTIIRLRLGGYCRIICLTSSRGLF